MKRAAAIVSLSAALLLSAPRPASSAPILIDSGAFHLALNWLQRTELWLSSEAGTPNGVFFSGNSFELDRAYVPALLQVGQAIDLSHTFNQDFDVAPDHSPYTYAYADIGGNIYTDIILRATDFRFVAEPAIVGTGAHPGAVLTPFTFTGRLSGFRTPGELLFAEELSGRGIAVLAAARTDAGLVPYGLGYVFQESAPIPEPATLLLVGSIILSMAGARAHGRLKERRR